MKKKILILSSIIAATSPVAFAISCGSNKNKNGVDSEIGRNGSVIGGGHMGSSNAHHFNLEAGIKDKFVNKSSSKTGAELEALSNTKILDLTADELGFAQPTLPAGYSASYSLESAYDASTGAPLNVIVTLIKAGFTPDSTISFSLSPITPLNKTVEIVNAIDYTSTKYPYEIASVTAIKQTGLTLTDLGLTINEHLPTGFNVTFDIPKAYTGVEDIPAITAHITNGTQSDSSIVKPLKLKVFDAKPIVDAFATATLTSTRDWNATQTWIQGLVPNPTTGKSPTTKLALNMDVASNNAWNAALSATSQSGITLENLVVESAIGSASAPQTFIDVEGNLNANGKFKIINDHVSFKLKLS